MRGKNTTILCLASLLVTLAGLSLSLSAEKKENSEKSASTVQEPKLVPLPKSLPAPKDNPQTSEKVELGKQLFFDPRLSGNNRVSCASCHLPEKAFTDGQARSEGLDGKPLGRNTPSVLNVAWLSSYFWDGRAATLEEQALGPIQAPQEMNQDLDRLEEELNAVSGYVREFRKVFGSRVTRKGIACALAAFQRSLVSRNSPFDRYLRGDEEALSPLAKRGLELFKGEADCIRCHHGPVLSDGQFYRLGVGFEDKGRGKVTGKAEDNYAFRTPPLRNVAQTAPYMHDGSKKDLFRVVEFYYRTAPSQAPDNRPLDISPLLGQSYTEISAIVEFLKSLDGEVPEMEKPELP